MLKPTIGPNWDNQELQDLDRNLMAIVQELKDDKLTPEQKQEKKELGREMFARWEPIKAGMREFDKIRAEVSNSENSPALTIEQKLEKLDQAKAIAIYLPYKCFFNQVIDDQTILLLSPEADALPAARKIEIASVVIIELSGRFKDIENDAVFIENQMNQAISEHNFARARFYSDEQRRFPKEKAELQAPINLLGLKAAVAVEQATPTEAPAVLEAAHTLLDISLLGGQSKLALQYAMLKLASKHVLPQDPATAFKTGQIIAETAESTNYQVLGIDLMFAAIKQHESAGEGNAAALLLSTQPRWGVPLQSKIVQDFVDIQLASLRAGTGLIEYSDRNTKPAEGAVEIFKYENPTPKPGQRVTNHTA